MHFHHRMKAKAASGREKVFNSFSKYFSNRENLECCAGLWQFFRIKRFLNIWFAVSSVELKQASSGARNFKICWKTFFILFKIIERTFLKACIYKTSFNTIFNYRRSFWRILWAQKLLKSHLWKAFLTQWSCRVQSLSKKPLNRPELCEQNEGKAGNILCGILNQQRSTTTWSQTRRGKSEQVPSLRRYFMHNRR